MGSIRCKALCRASAIEPGAYRSLDYLPRYGESGKGWIMKPKIMDSAEHKQILKNLEDARLTVKKHLLYIENENSLYNHLAIYNIAKALDGITDALIGLRGE